MIRKIKNLICYFCAFIAGVLFVIMSKLADRETAKVLYSIFLDVLLDGEYVIQSKM